MPVVDQWLAELARLDERYRSTGDAKGLVECLRSIGTLGDPAALTTVAGYVAHPGEYTVPEEIIYWDWTMDPSCTEVRPAYQMTVAGAAVGALGRIGPASLPWLEDVCRSANPLHRLIAIRSFNDPRMAPVASRGEELAREELARADCANRVETSRLVCECRLLGDPTPAAAVALIGDSVNAIAIAAMTMTYEEWPRLLTPDQQRQAGAEFRAALLARFDDPDFELAASAIAALMNACIASREVEPAVRGKQTHRDPRIRQQVGNVLARNDQLRLPPSKA
ncbi:hypothetical protein [Limnoglobus roseus]|uniref:hypothetical protein n=1 Tax=Limnoglobus roseus TaxID=2598579 RepID=UPI00143D8357|nr:hypothetical protein [Limnoglobus roseus]